MSTEFGRCGDPPYGTTVTRRVGGPADLNPQTHEWFHMSTNYLKAVFWDYPELCDPKAVEMSLKEARSKNDRKTLEWLMARFLERGRFKDTAFFSDPRR